MSKVVEGRTQKRSAQTSSTAGEDFPKAVAGFVESDKFTVCGEFIASSCCNRGSYCVFRTSRKHIIAIVNSEHCKWCKDALFTSVKERGFDEVRTRVYLRGIFQFKSVDSMKLSELIQELTYTPTNTERHSLQFTCTPPYCTVENVTHISSLALQKLFEFDKDFVWGDNLIFNTNIEPTQLSPR